MSIKVLQNKFSSLFSKYIYGLIVVSPIEWNVKFRVTHRFIEFIDLWNVR